MNTFRPKLSILCLPKNLDIDSLYSVERSELEYNFHYFRNGCFERNKTGGRTWPRYPINFDRSIRYLINLALLK